MKRNYLWLLGLTPLIFACNNSKTSTAISNLKETTAFNEEVSEEACTVMYVGKTLSKNGKAFIARSSDAGPAAMCINTTIFEHNELANKTITSNKGFSYKMPSTTYRYISTPRNPVMNKGHHWEASAVNENGVGVSATLSCYGKSTIISEGGHDPLVPTGIGEDNIAQIIGATAKTAREGIETIADIIEKQGSCDCNAIMTIDQNEAWYMEIYSGHQFAAVKCPDDKILTAGNEFVFDSLKHMGIKIEDTILSGGLVDKIPEIERDPQYCKDVMELNLFETYSEQLVKYGADTQLPLDDTEQEKIRIETDNSHRRTWCGYHLFAPSQFSKYCGVKYPAFYDPDDGFKSLDIHDVTRFMRDRFETVTDSNFDYDRDKNQLRYVACERAYQVHAIQSDPSLPKEMAATMWLSLCNPNYTPFVPINAGVNSMSDYYTHVSPTYSYDEQSGAHIFKKLNALAFTRREEYGKPIEELWNNYESIWEQEYNTILNKTSEDNVGKRRDILTNYTKTTQEKAIKLAKFMTDDLTWHMMSDQTSEKQVFTKFKPCVNVKDYSHSFGYEYSKDGDTVTLRKGNDIITIKLTSTEYRPGEHSSDYRYTGELTHGDIKEEVQLGVDNGEFYVPYSSISKYIQGDIVINPYDYVTPPNNLAWILPISIGIPVIAGGVTFFVLKKRKMDKLRNNDTN